MSPWGQGSATVDQMLADGRLERVPANPVAAQGLIDKAQTHLGSAAVLAGTDVELAYDALHAANRKALTAVLLAQGLRPTRIAGHTDRCHLLVWTRTADGILPHARRQATAGMPR